uniref:Uncharacterized protein n=1 Tax=Oryza sativa subsp. japonica TaxID=39947 RepID=Q7XDI8_ORYSJ|nr:hypothetical protein LOC_Os10g33200 [Oryza sativa Japonica Group]
MSRGGPSSSSARGVWLMAADLAGDRPQKRGEEDPRRKPSLALDWAGSSYAFGRGNPLEGVAEVPSFLDGGL